VLAGPGHRGAGGPPYSSTVPTAEETDRGPGSAAPRVAAVLTAYRPGASLLDVVLDAVRECGRVVVVDNTEPGGRGVDPAALPEGVQVIVTGYNAGLAGGLNTGLAAVLDAAGGEPPVDAVLLLDQDSRVPQGMVAALAAGLGPGVAAVGPAPWDAEHDRYLDPRARLRPQVADVATLITSGMLVRAQALREAGPLRESFFVDCVDQDLCLRLRRSGWRLLQDRRVRLPHSLGEVRRHGVGPLRVRATHHPTWRLYWVARNGLVLARENWRAEPAWVAVSLVMLARWLVVVAAVEPPRGPRLAAFLAGLRDGLTGRSDPARRPGARP